MTGIIGVKELERALSDLPKATGKGVLRRALKNAAGPIQQAAQSAAPVGATGNLRESISIETKLKPSQRQGKREPVELFIGATSPTGNHAHLVEFGTVKTSPHPFLRPAWEAGKQKMLDAIGAEIWKEIRKSAKRLARKATRL